jgi:hypothetical protein
VDRHGRLKLLGYNSINPIDGGQDQKTSFIHKALSLMVDQLKEGDLWWTLTLYKGNRKESECGIK